MSIKATAGIYENPLTNPPRNKNNQARNMPLFGVFRAFLITYLFSLTEWGIKFQKKRKKTERKEYISLSVYF